MGGSYRWPTVEKTKQFRLKVRELINKVIDRTPLQLPVNWDHPWVLGIILRERMRYNYHRN